MFATVSRKLSYLQRVPICTIQIVLVKAENDMYAYQSMKAVLLQPTQLANYTHFLEQLQAHCPFLPEPESTLAGGQFPGPSP